MGNNISTSHSHDHKYIVKNQISQIKNGTISTISFQIFLRNFYFFSRYELFYTELPLEKQLLILDCIGPLSKKECTTYLKNFCLFSEKDEETLYQSLRLISYRMICKTHDKDSDVYLPIGFDKYLFKSIMLKKFATIKGKIKITKEKMNWSNAEILNDRNIFINEKQNQIPHILHNKDLSLLIQNNYTDLLWKSSNVTFENNIIDQKVSKPLRWIINIHSAASEGKKSSIKYSLSLLPQIINLTDLFGQTMAHHAAKKNQKNVLIYLQRNGADFNLFDCRGNLPINLISKKSLIYIMNDLGIDINARNKDCLSLIDIRMKARDKKMVKTLIELGVNIFEPNPKGAYFMQTAMQGTFAVYNLHEFIAQILTKNKDKKWYENPIIKEYIDSIDKDGIINSEKSSLLQAVKNQDIDRVKVLLALGKEPDMKMPKVVSNLYYCAQNGLTEMAQILLDNYCNPNKIDENRHNTFWVAMNEHFETASLIHKYGVKLNVVDSSGETLLHCAYRLKKNNVLKFALQKGANPNIKNKNGQSLTFLAFQTRDDEVAELLQNKCKGNINTQDENKNSLAHLAILQGDLDRVDYLYKHHINMNLKNNKGHTVLMLAFLNGANISTLEFLAKRGSNFNSVDNQNNNLLHYLMNSKNPPEEIFNYLIDKNIDFSLENAFGQFPISIAIKNHHDKLGLKLLEMGCAIHDKTSEHEPIVEALNRNSSKWFEILVNNGADALNEKVGVLSRYIESGFYKYTVFKKITKMNIFIESPFQTALYNECYKY